MRFRHLRLIARVHPTAIYNAKSGGADICVSSATDCDSGEAAINSACQARSGCVTSLMQGYNSVTKTCAVPKSATDCTGASPTAIYNAKSGGTDICVSSTTDCDSGEAAINSACQARSGCVTSLMQGYNSVTKTCAVPTSATDCTGASPTAIYNAKSGGTDICVSSATDCDSGEAAINSACQARSGCVTSLMQGYNSVTKTCAVPTSATDCTGASPTAIYNAKSGGRISVFPLRPIAIAEKQRLTTPV